jgi:acyl-coenzyme A synthetase/AMP-(fatty) acid ligase
MHGSGGPSLEIHVLLKIDSYLTTTISTTGSSFMGSNAVPYLSLSVSQAAELPHPSHPEPIDHSTFTSLLKHRAEHQSAQIAVGFPHLKEKECLTYTFEQLYNQSSKLAQRIRCIIAPRCKDGIQPVIALLGPSGPVFLLHATASWLLGAAVLPIAIGTTSKGANGLLSKCGCNVVLYSKRQASQIAEMQSMIETESGPLMMEWTDLEANEADRETSLPPIYTAKPKDNLVIFHSSGSSGTPKPLAQCHGFWSKSLLTASGREAAAFTTTPLFHGGLSDLFRSVQASASLYFFPWHLSIAPTVDNIVESVKSCGQDIRYFLSVPFILEMLIKSNEGSSLLKEMDMVSTGGAPLPEAVGDTATKEHNIKLVSRLGSSECGFLMSSYRDFDADKDWSWLRVPDKLGQQWLKFESISEQEADVYELVVSSEWPTKQLSNRPDGSFATGDLYERHPEHPNQWRYKRRNDDIIVMVNGKKIPGSLVESALCSSPLIKEAIVFGSNRALLGAIIFPSDSSDQERNLQKLKEHLQMMNRSMPSHGRIALEMIHVGDSNLQSSLPRSSKGTLQKGIALDTMAGLIDDVYRRFEEGEAPRTEDRKSLSGEELRAWLKALVESVCDNSIGVDDDFYRSGIDSIMAARIRAGVHQGLEIDGFRLQSKDVYDHPTITLLSKYIDNRGKAIEAGRDEIMMNMVKKYSNFSPIKAKDDGITSNCGITVILTGATGALGCRLLYELLEGEHKVDNVVCLVRAKDGMAARERVKSAVKERGLILAEKKIDCVSNLFELSMKKCLTGAKSLSIIHVSTLSLDLEMVADLVEYRAHGLSTLHFESRALKRTASQVIPLMLALSSLTDLSLSIHRPQRSS